MKDTLIKLILLEPDTELAQRILLVINRKNLVSEIDQQIMRLFEIRNNIQKEVSPQNVIPLLRP